MHWHLHSEVGTAIPRGTEWGNDRRFDAAFYDDPRGVEQGVRSLRVEGSARRVTQPQTTSL
jgi:hypothetical protein